MVKKLDKFLFIGWSVAVFILLVDISNCMFNLFPNNIVSKPIIDESFQKNSVLNLTHELNKNDKISFLDVLIDTNNNNNSFTTSTYKKPTNNNSCILNFKSECPFQYKKAIINNLISYAKLISSSKTIFHEELRNLEQTHQWWVH